MASTTRLWITVAGGAAAVGLLTAVITGTRTGSASSTAYELSPAGYAGRSTGHSTVTKTVTLPNHRQAEFTSVSDKGLTYRFRNNSQATWSTWREIYQTHTASCGDLITKAQNGSIAVIAGYSEAGDCVGGDMPTTEIAVVTTGDLTTYDSNHLSHEPWQKITFSQRGAEVEFSSDYVNTSGKDHPHQRTAYVRWNQGAGFGKQHLV